MATVPGTPQAKEALIANSIPQTAKVKTARKATYGRRLTGAPKIKRIEGTPMKYAVNSPTPVIRVEGERVLSRSKRACGSRRPTAGPWTVATSVPAVIYAIPP